MYEKAVFNAVSYFIYALCIGLYSLFPLRSAVGTLLTVFGLLAGGATAMGTRDVLFLLGLRLHLAAAWLTAFGRATEDDAAFENLVKIVHNHCLVV